MREAVSGEAWLQAFLDVERALASAEAKADVIPAAAAEAIASACLADRFDLQAIALDSRRAGNPVEPLVRALSAAVGSEAAPYVHRGATSQDVLDTAAMLVAQRTLDLIVAETDGVAASCAELADRHRSTLMAGRTLLQHALPTTFGLKAAGWLVAVLEARDGLDTIREGGLNVQLGGAAGTLASLGKDGVTVLRLFADELGLGEPVVPWHTNRVRIAALGAALDIAAGTSAKIALDVVLLAQTEVGEVAEPANGGRGGSSTLPHKQNPVGATLASACARGAHAAASLLTGAMAQEHERAAGAWHAEWRALGDALALTAGAASWIREVLEGLEVNEERMRANLDLTRGAVLAESVVTLVSDRLGRLEAQGLVREASLRAADSGRALRDELLEDPRVDVTPGELDAALDPVGYLGSADVFVDRALELYRDRPRA